jgi:NADH:ubiquinone oxidoreductase subunit E
MLYTEPKGKHIIRICNSPSCYLNHSLTLIKFLESLLKIKSGQTTKDKKVSLEIVSCLGCCDKSPAMMINNQVYGNLDERKIRKIISGLR